MENFEHLTGDVLQSMNPSVLQHGPSYLPSEGIVEDVILYEATAISSSDGETIALKDKVCNIIITGKQFVFISIM